MSLLSKAKQVYKTTADFYLEYKRIHNTTLVSFGIAAGILVTRNAARNEFKETGESFLSPTIFDHIGNTCSSLILLADLFMITSYARKAADKDIYFDRPLRAGFIIGAVGVGANVAVELPVTDGFIEAMNFGTDNPNVNTPDIVDAAVGAITSVVAGATMGLVNKQSGPVT